MRFNFDLSDSLPEPSQRSLTPKEQLEWVPLQKHPFFTSSKDVGAIAIPYGAAVSLPPRNLLAWDGSSRLYYWDTNKQCLHRISIRLGEPEPTSVLAASPSKELRPEVQVNFVVERISINRSGSAVIVAGCNGLSVMYLYGRSSNKDDAIDCRSVSVGSQLYLNGTNALRVLQVLWHPYSDTHVGVLSSDSVFRLFDLSSNVMQPEQEFYLQPMEPGRSKKAASLCPVNFCFGGDHLWDRFSVFILFSDGSVYILCPVVPFRSVYKWESVMEIYGDAQTYGLKSANAKAVHNSSTAISWLKATFPELAEEAVERANLATVKAHPHALFDASLSLQGPLRKVCQGKEDVGSRGAECEGGAVSLFYNLAGKDTIIVVGWSGGQLQIDALADEIQPLWNVGSPPRVCVDSRDRILGLAMICEAGGFLEEEDDSILNEGTEVSVWLGRPPPLLRLAIVDLALPGKANGGAYIVPDPLIPERMYCVHDGGIDSIVLHFLPFTSQSNGKVRTPSVHPVLLGGSSSSLPVCGCVALSDSFGYSWIVGVIADKECVVIEMRSWDMLLPPPPPVTSSSVEENNKEEMEEEVGNTMMMMISKELLNGPKAVVVPQAPSSLGSVGGDSIEGRSILHQYLKLFHENYVEYAHKVYFEVKHNAGQVKRIIQEQEKRLREAQERLVKVEKKQSVLDERMDGIIEKQNGVDQRMRRLRNLPAAHNKPLSRAERDLKAQLDQFARVDLDALRSSVEALKARLRRTKTTTTTKSINKKTTSTSSSTSRLQDEQISLLKSSLQKLSLVNSDNLSKLKLVDSAIKTREEENTTNSNS